MKTGGLAQASIDSSQELEAYRKKFREEHGGQGGSGDYFSSEEDKMYSYGHCLSSSTDQKTTISQLSEYDYSI